MSVKTITMIARCAAIAVNERGQRKKKNLAHPNFAKRLREVTEIMDVSRDEERVNIFIKSLIKFLK